MAGLLVNDVDHTFFDKHIRNHNLRAVDKDIVAVNGHMNIALGQSGDVHAIREHSGVHDGILYDVVAEYALELLYGYVAQGRADCLEGLIVGDEGCKVGWERTASKTGLRNSPKSGGIVKLNEGGGDVLWNGEEVVNDVDDATSEIYVLTSISRAWADREA